MLFQKGSVDFDNLKSVLYIKKKRIWQFKLPFQATTLSFESVVSLSSPAVADGVVYIGGSDGNLYALDASSGGLLWHFKTTKNMTLTSPAIDEGILCVCSSDGYLYAVDVTTREQLLYQPAVAEHILCVGSGEGLFYALDLETTQPIWTFKTGDFWYWSSPIIADGIVYLGSEGFLQTLNLETGEKLWQFQPLDSVLIFPFSVSLE